MKTKQTYNQWIKQLSKKPIPKTTVLLNRKSIDYKNSLN